tara:strand:+ start:28997 stop:29509 length:513 start_codon:yes stop_codon:yes gene_type:complete
MKNFLNTIEFPEFAKDNKLNASNILMNNNKLIDDELVAGTILAIFYSKNENVLASNFIESAGEILSDSLINGAKAAANIMNMNNIFYRGKHYLGKNYEKVAANLRMNIYTKHGIDKKYFEFMSLAVSFINGCEFCVKSHAMLLRKEGMNEEQIHEALRIAAIFNTIRESY